MINEITSNLIYDIGIHKGEDTAYYLSKGYSVIGIDANIDMIDYCHQRFLKEIECGKLTLIHGAITSEAKSNFDSIVFYKNEDNSVWGTTKESWAIRNEKRNTTNTMVDVKPLNFAEIISEYGMPFYMKIDIEGEDIECVKVLQNFSCVPTYISIESDMVKYRNILKEINLLQALGYTKFCAQNQNDVKYSKDEDFSFEFGSSGPFGQFIKNNWVRSGTIKIIYAFIFLGYCLFGNKSKVKHFIIVKALRKILSKIFNVSIPYWYDTHAKK